MTSSCGARMIGGTSVEGAKPLYEIVSDKPDGEMISVAIPAFSLDSQTTKRVLH